MEHGSEPEHFVLCSERIILECKCGEMLVLLGREDDWYSEERTVFRCECGEKLSLADRLDEEALGVRQLINSLRTPNS